MPSVSPQPEDPEQDQLESGNEEQEHEDNNGENSAAAGTAGYPHYYGYPQGSPSGDGSTATEYPNAAYWNTGYIGIPMHMPVGVSPGVGANGKPKRKQVKNACTNCQTACKRCDDERPCGRCVKYGLSDTCQNSARKERKKGIKRGPYKKRKDPTEMENLEEAGGMPADGAMGPYHQGMPADYAQSYYGYYNAYFQNSHMMAGHNPEGEEGDEGEEADPEAAAAHAAHYHQYMYPFYQGGAPPNAAADADGEDTDVKNEDGEEQAAATAPTASTSAKKGKKKFAAAATPASAAAPEVKRGKKRKAEVEPVIDDCRGRGLNEPGSFSGCRLLLIRIARCCLLSPVFACLSPS
ncbi:hypothetical protein BKA62DRAFT_373770 [Auriculariales sp. MPI-PUGE-AT-0066]|nr:hypothetical protein BKA62DRAFT_373770 [Auriculariales sp. MPI-PUGE-AT-0066]